MPLTDLSDNGFPKPSPAKITEVRMRIHTEKCGKMCRTFLFKIKRSLKAAPVVDLPYLEKEFPGTGVATSFKYGLNCNNQDLATVNCALFMLGLVSLSFINLQIKYSKRFGTVQMSSAN